METDVNHITNCARSNVEWETVYRHIFLNPQNFFRILPDRRWSIAHQTVLHGDVYRFKCFLSLFSNDQIDIHAKTKDNLTLLDIAVSKKDDNPAMYAYIERLFRQDELLEKAKEFDWRSVIEMLESQQELANEKPPYCPSFLLHYVVEGGSPHVLEELLQIYKCVTTVRNDRSETPLQLAIRLKKHDMCSIFEKRTTSQSPVLLKNSDRPENPLKRQAFPKSPDSNRRSPSTAQPTSPSSSSGNSTLSPIGFESLVNDLTQMNISTNSEPSSPPSKPIGKEPKVLISDPKPRVYKSIIRECSPTKYNPTSCTELSSVDENSASSSSTPNPVDEQLMKKLKCPLSRKIMVDPVIASDGYTYERAVIIDWINTYGFSPANGQPMDATFQDNVEVKKMLQSYRNRK